MKYRSHLSYTLQEMRREMREKKTMVKSDASTRGKMDNSILQSKRKKGDEDKDENVENKIIKDKEGEKDLMSIVSALLSLKSTRKINKDDPITKKAKVKKTMCLSAIGSNNTNKICENKQVETKVEINPSYNYRNYWADKQIRVPTENLNDVDNFSWRSNGTKKLVGLSHLRRYYKCSKNGCGVHKIVDHDPNDPSMLIICYNGEHNHTIP